MTGARDEMEGVDIWVGRLKNGGWKGGSWFYVSVQRDVPLPLFVFCNLASVGDQLKRGIKSGTSLQKDILTRKPGER